MIVVGPADVGGPQPPIPVLWLIMVDMILFFKSSKINVWR